MRSLGRIDHLVAGAIGEPGRRIFLIEVGSPDGLEWFLVEKEQVAALARGALEALRIAGRPPVSGKGTLSDPGDPTFRVGEIGLGAEGDEFVVILTPDDASEGVSMVVPAPVLAAMASGALEVVGAGRPTCPFCGLPRDPDGHVCPAGNGHRGR